MCRITRSVLFKRKDMALTTIAETQTPSVPAGRRRAFCCPKRRAAERLLALPLLHAAPDRVEVLGRPRHSCPQPVSNLLHEGLAAGLVQLPADASDLARLRAGRR